jgi:restriction system protein
MVLRQARSGANAGKQFWGCSRYAQDRCRGTRELD